MACSEDQGCFVSAITEVVRGRDRQYDERNRQFDKEAGGLRKMGGDRRCSEDLQGSDLARSIT